MAREIKDYKRLYQDLLVSKTGDYVYTMVPKSGNTTLKYTLWASENSANGYGIQCPDSFQVGLQNNPEAPYTALDEKYDIRVRPDAQVFTVVRNPYARALSGFLDKGNRTHSSTFKEHLEKIVNVEPLQLNHHFAPMWSIVWPEIIRYDSIVPIESFPEGVNSILEDVFGGEYTFFSQRHSVKTMDRFREHFGEDEINLVLKIYEKDFDVFNYSKQLEDIWDVPEKAISTGTQHVSTLFEQIRKIR